MTKICYGECEFCKHINNCANSGTTDSKIERGIDVED